MKCMYLCKLLQYLKVIKMENPGDYLSISYGGGERGASTLPGSFTMQIQPSSGQGQTCYAVMVVMPINMLYRCKLCSTGK